MPIQEEPMNRLLGSRHLPPHADSHRFTITRPSLPNLERRRLVTVAPLRAESMTHGLELRDCSFCIAGQDKPRGRTSFQIRERTTPSLHTTSNALLRRAVLALGEPGIGPGTQRYQLRIRVPRWSTSESQPAFLVREPLHRKPSALNFAQRSGRTRSHIARAAPTNWRHPLTGIDIHNIG